MPVAVLRTPRTSWIEEGLRRLADGGPEAVRVEVLAQALGVTKGGFYGQFADRRALLEEMLETWERRVIDEVIEQVESGGGDAKEKLWRLFTLASASPANRQILRMELAVRDWARRDPAVAERLARVDRRRMNYMRPLFSAFSADAAEVEARCLLVFSLFVGSHFVAVEHGPLSRGDVLERALQHVLA